MTDQKPAPSAAGAFFVAAGILASRVMGLVRVVVFANYFGNSMPSAAFAAALRIPNFLQNLFGEGVLSASFIPVYAGLLGKGDRHEADRVAGAVFGLLSLATAVMVAAGMAFAPELSVALAPGFQGEARELTARLVRILFPGVGLLVFSAWCLGILNSHRRFLLSYAAPVIWNAAIIATLLLFGGRRDLIALAELAAWGTSVGCLLQFAVQLPSVLRLFGEWRLSLGWHLAGVRQVLRGFGPAVLGRGVVQISAWVDLIYASLISERAVSALNFAQTFYLLPVSLFGMAISAAELPELSRAAGTGVTDDVKAVLRQRLAVALSRISFFVIPSAVAFIALGDVVSGILQRGAFTAADTRYSWYLLMGSGVGLLAATMGRLYASTFYALKDTTTPLLYAALRVALTAGLAWYSVRYLPVLLNVPSEMGAVGITATTGIAAWLECLLLKAALSRRIGQLPSGLRASFALWTSAVLAAAAALGLKWWLTQWFGIDVRAAQQWGGTFLLPAQIDPKLQAMAVLGLFGAVYFAATFALGVPQARLVFAKIRKAV